MEDYLDLFDDENKKVKSFNTSGVCIEDEHYMVNINNKLRQIMTIICILIKRKEDVMNYGGVRLGILL